MTLLFVAFKRNGSPRKDNTRQGQKRQQVYKGWPPVPRWAYRKVPQEGQVR
ncbi:MAG: hypothetical protein HC767_07590 [Akkermansiaceae bacterium]|nr:hypothetical protein [Akkermansiaceae bacterium]